MINIAKNPEDRIEKKGTQKGYAQTGVVVFEKKKRSEKSESEKRFAQTEIVLFQKRKGSEKKVVLRQELYFSRHHFLP